MHGYLYFHISDTNVCAYAIKHIFHESSLLLPLSLVSKSLQAQELHGLLTPGHLFYFLDPCKMLCQEWALHQDMFTNIVAKVFQL